MSKWYSYHALALLGVGLALVCWAVSPPHKTRTHLRGLVQHIDFNHDLKPILEARCCRCHGAHKHKAGLRLDSATAIRAGADGGTVVVPGDSAGSLLMAVLHGSDDVPRMPPAGKPLTPSQMALVKAWIDAGAPVPAGEPALSNRLTHWAFQPPAQPSVPVTAEPHANPIDAFLASQRERRGLVPNPPASRDVLLRRVFIDLIGLPPTRTELEAFRADRSDHAYEKVVERLLASPRYGERWARHWMDVWRYSDPDGRKAKKDTWWSNRYIWRWRDWIIRSLNEDKGYDRMVVEMLAGDEVAPGDPQALAATGFLVRDWFKLDRNIWMNNTVEHTAKAFLGVTINCARCHNHKFDPITQREHYQFRAIFEPYDVREDKLPVGPGGKREPVAHAYDLNPHAPTYIYVRGDIKHPDHSTPITPGVPAALGGPPLCITPVKTAGCGPSSSGRRLALARWLVDRRNPLTARVAVNHVWARHFGTPLVENVYDFGLRTKPPAQQALLNWLAVQFMEHHWSMKWLHRTIVTSEAYRMRSSARGTSAVNLTIDPDNDYYWRMNAQRMEAEVVRDSLLALSGDLDLHMYGPPLDCFATAGPYRRSIYYRYSREDKMEFLTVFDAASTEECYRREQSIVPQQALALENSDFVWDRARRIAHQLDPPSDRRSARAFIAAAFEHILNRAPDATELRACGRFLTSQEQLLGNPARLTAFTPGPAAGVKPAADAAGRAREYLVHALINHNDFITIR
ncbi:MAG TPA: PSD1 and planctomycete cytochrome C domain-containing protein [Gemmataceae bacterium]|nr:PSD1 and planctomycete cytochrome C domain-containing protein [Gemmataceae bacterium]